MITLYLIIAVALIAAGAIAGFMVVISWGIHREEARYSLTVHPPGRAAAGARVTNGVHARFPGVIQEARYYHRDPGRPGREGRSDDHGLRPPRPAGRGDQGPGQLSGPVIRGRPRRAVTAFPLPAGRRPGPAARHGLAPCAACRIYHCPACGCGRAGAGAARRPPGAGARVIVARAPGPRPGTAGFPHRCH